MVVLRSHVGVPTGSRIDGTEQVTPTLRLVRLLGKGGMGSVWVADHLALGIQVAVKLMEPELARDHGFAERFRREAMAAARMKSPHVAQVFDHGVTADGVPYIVMEMLDGETLKSRIRRLGPLPPLEVSRIILQTAKALGRAHQLGIVHRDIKPDNLFLIDVEGELFLKVLDFGIAKLAMAGDVGGTATGSILGTPLYMSPEQLVCSKHVDLRADLWSLGVVAYHALTGKPPFSGDGFAALAIAINAGIFAPPSAVRPGLPPALDAWMSKVLQRDPLARFGTARELAAAFEQAVGVTRSSLPSVGDFAAPATAEQPRAPKAPAAAAPPAQAPTFTGIASTTPRSSRSRAPVFLVAATLTGTLLVAGALWQPTGKSGPGSSGTASAASSPGAIPAAPEPAAPEPAAPEPAAPEETFAAPGAPLLEVVPPVSARARAPSPPSKAKPPSTATAAPATSAAPRPTATAAPQATPATPATSATAPSQKKHEGLF